MLHARLHIAQLEIGGEPVALRYGDLVVVARAESAQLDWEVVVHTTEPTGLENGHHDLSMTCIDGVEDSGALTTTALSGPAFLVRSVGSATVLRGSGHLDGFHMDRLVG